MKTFASVVAMCMLASASANAPYFPSNAALSISDSEGTARATTATMEDEYGEVIVIPNAVYTQVEGNAFATALTEGNGVAVAGAEQDGRGVAVSDLSSAESTNWLFAEALKNDEDAIAYSTSDSYTTTSADDGFFMGGFAYAQSGMGIFECDGGCGPETTIEIREATENESGALASLISNPYPHQAATYSRSAGDSFSQGAGFLSGMTAETDTFTMTEQVAVIDVVGIEGMYADALSDSSALAEAEAGLP